MRHRRLLGLALAGGAALACACNALTGVSDLSADLCVECSDGGPLADAVVPRSDASSRDGSAIDSGAFDAGPRPTYCTGLVLYTSYDDGFEPEFGDGPDPVPSPGLLTSGRFGKGLRSTGDKGSFFYPMDEKKNPYPAMRGTMAAWFKADWIFPQSEDRILLKPVLDPLATVNSSGPQLRFYAAAKQLGLFNQNVDSGAFVGAAIDVDKIVPAWKPLEFNHLVGAWNRTTPSLKFWLNGGQGQGVQAVSNAPWAPQVNDTGALRIGSNVIPADGTFDELTLWDRELSDEEVTAIYTSKVTIAEACNL